MIIELSKAKKHLNIDEEFKADDQYIESLIVVAEESVSIHLNYKSLYSLIAKYGEMPAAVEHAVLLLVGNLYANREPVAYNSAVKVPYSYEYLLSLYRNYNDLEEK